MSALLCGGCRQPIWVNDDGSTECGGEGEGGCAYNLGEGYEGEALDPELVQAAAATHAAARRAEGHGATGPDGLTHDEDCAMVTGNVAGDADRLYCDCGAADLDAHQRAHEAGSASLEPCDLHPGCDL